MPTDLVQDKKFKWIMWAQIFLVLGFLASPTVVALYHILIFIPAILVFTSGERVSIPKSGWALLTLALWGAVCNTVNLDDLIKVRKSYDDLKFYISGPLLLLPLKYFYDRATDHQIKRMFKILFFVIVASFIVGISKAYFQFDLVKMQSGVFKNRSGGFTNYMRYGYASSFLFILGLSMWINYEKVKKLISSKMLISAIVLCFLAVIAAKTRGAILAILVGVPFLYLKYQPKIAKAVIALGTVFVLVVGVISFSGIKTNSRFLNIKDGSNKKRMSQFYSAVKSIQEKPVFGVGAAQFAYHVPRIKKDYDIWSKEYSGHSHNIFLEHAANSGIPGLFMFLAFLVLWGWELIKRNDHIGWAFASYLVAFVVSGQVENLFDNTNSHLLFYIYCLSHVLPRGERKEEAV
jgi:O-antigen ligase